MDTHNADNPDELELWNRAKADLSEWRRKVEENDELKREIQALRQKYRLPPRSTSYSEATKFVLRWITSDVKTYISMYEELDELAVKHGLEKEAFRAGLLSLAIHGHPMLALDMGYPRLKYAGIRKETSVIIDKNVPITNPLIIEFIKEVQQFADDEIPIPVVIPGHPRKKKDWRPLWEWKMRHPDVTHKEIAYAIGVGRVTVSTKLGELNSQM